MNGLRKKAQIAERKEGKIEKNKDGEGWREERKKDRKKPDTYGIKVRGKHGKDFVLTAAALGTGLPYPSEIMHWRKAETWTQTRFYVRPSTAGGQSES